MPFRRHRKTQTPSQPPPSPGELVALYLRGQNLEQMRQTAQAVACYEEAVAAGFDAAGPYDRLLHIYRQAGANADIVRVAEAAMARVRTHEQKAAWYREMRDNAAERSKRHPDRRGPEF